MSGATDAILAERGATYGRFVDLAELCVSLKTQVRAHRAAFRKTPFAADQAEALDMILHKVARIANGDADHVDSWRDIAGYATLVAERLEGHAR
jgi:hypothetical protein